MYSIGRISELAARDKQGYFIGKFLKPEDPWFSKRFESAYQLLNSDMEADLLPHAHQYVEEVTVVLKGCLRVEVEGQIKELKEGEVIFVRPRTPIKIIGADDGTILFIVKAPSLPQDKYVANGTSKDKE